MPRITDHMNFAGTGEIAGSATAAQMPDRDCRGVVFSAPSSNTGNVYIGGDGVTAADGTTDQTTGLALRPGAMSPFLTVGNLDELYYISDNAADDLTYLLYGTLG